MKRLKNRLLIFAIIMTYAGAGISQGVSYGYDPAGNRIKREIILQTDGNSPKKAPEKSISREMMSDKIIKIYPNPTRGMLKVEIDNIDDSETGLITIYDYNGVVRLSYNKIESTMAFDISGYSNGMYFMHIQINEYETTWKIIKQ